MSRDDGELNEKGKGRSRMAKSSTYQRLKQADAKIVKPKSTPARSPRSTLERLRAAGAQGKATGAASTYDRLRTLGSGGPLRQKAAAVSPYEQAVLDEIQANALVEASAQALNAAYDNQSFAMARRAALKIQALNGGQADLVNEIDDRYWRELDGQAATPPPGKIARVAFGFGGK